MVTETLPPKPPPQGSVSILPPSKVAGLFGNRGSGKSALMCYFGLEEYKRGKKIYYYPESYGLNVGTPMSPSELVRIPEKLNNSTVLIDEIQELLSKYRANTTATMMLMSFFRQVRKRGVNVIFTSNDPMNINQSVASQTDLHGYLRMYPDDRCFHAGYHLMGPLVNKECKDYIKVEWRDTQRQYTQGKKKNTLWTTYTHIARMYGKYDTASIADPSEVMRLTKASVVDSKVQENLGMSWAELEVQIQEVIGVLISTGHFTLIPNQFVKVLSREKKIDIDSRILGKTLKNMGLFSKRTSGGMVYALPPDMETWQLWIDGLWASPEFDKDEE